MLAVPGFKAERCVRYRYSYSACSRCADACPHDAIRLSNDGVEVLADHCKSCALCVAVCPTEALGNRDVSFAALNTRRGDAQQMTIACAPSGIGADAVVPCLGALDAVTLAEFARRGVALKLAGTARCGVCEHAAKGPEMIALNHEAYRLLCDQAGLQSAAWVELEVPGDEAAANVHAQDTSRRDLFRRLVSHSADVISGKLEQAPAPLMAIRAAAPFLPDRKMLLNGLFSVPEGTQVRVTRHVALPAEGWQVNRGCTYCEACVRVCPTGAIQLLESVSAWRLAFLNDRCVACDVCAEVCQPKVMHPSSADDVIVNKQKGHLLAAVEKKRCPRCDRVFVNEHDSEMCPICMGDDEDFAEIFG